MRGGEEALCWYLTFFLSLPLLLPVGDDIVRLKRKEIEWFFFLNGKKKKKGRKEVFFFSDDNKKKKKKKKKLVKIPLWEAHTPWIHAFVFFSFFFNFRPKLKKKKKNEKLRVMKNSFPSNTK